MSPTMLPYLAVAPILLLTQLLFSPVLSIEATQDTAPYNRAAVTPVDDIDGLRTGANQLELELPAAQSVSVPSQAARGSPLARSLTGGLGAWQRWKRARIERRTENERKHAGHLNSHGRLFDLSGWFSKSDFPTEVLDDWQTDDEEEEEEAKVEPAGTNPFWPMSEKLYKKNFARGDISKSLWDKCLTDPKDLAGTWQIDVGRSDSPNALLAALGISRRARRVVSTYPSTVIMSLRSRKPAHQPTMNIVTYLPMGVTKQVTVKFNGKRVTQQDSNTGPWKTVPYFVNGRAMQRRVSPRGVMYDVRCALPSDPAGRIRGNVMLFKWTFVPKGRGPIVAHRWMRKL
eukprot:GHVS01028048.1.p1 GENE.GHVS01028048.1~~GHVS01028048.1.p1  ORF type:complete len:344 (+),score=40.12 GHVS01028048.1:101-1132(+)